MAQNFPRLCGGTFLTLLLRALKKKHKNGSKQGLTEPECFMGLIRVITPKYDFPAAESTIKQDTSKYKNCVLNPATSSWLPFDVPEYIEPFNELVTSRYGAVLRRMIDFGEQYIDADIMGNWLVNALLELIADDEVIGSDALFYVQPEGNAVTKADMLYQGDIKLQAFLLGVWHYVIMNASDSTIGQATLENYLTDVPTVTGAKRTLKKSVGYGKRFSVEVHILPKAWMPQKSEEIDIYEGDIAPELTETPPIIVIPQKSRERTAFSDDEFAAYLSKVKDKYSKVRTLLYFYEPHPFYEFYVCNTVERRIPYKRNSYTVKRYENTTAESLLECSNFIIIAGTGGIGKSMMMQHLLLNAVDNYRETKRLPIFIPLKDYTPCPNLLQYVYQKFEALGGVSMEKFEKVLLAGRAILLFDGLDEINTENRSSFEQNLEYFTDKYTNNLFVLSTRPYVRIAPYSRFSIMRLLPFNKRQSLELIDKLEYRADDPAVKQKFREQLDETLFDTHREFAENPLLLTIMLMTFEQYAKVSPKMHRFYREAYETLASKHDALKNAYTRQFRTGLDSDKFAEYFAEFCAVTYYNQKYELTDSEFREFFNGLIICDEEKPSFGYKDFQSDLCNCLCLMYPESGVYHFSHRSFQEYFCALYFSRQMDDKLYDIAIDAFENTNGREGDKTFAMLYDMIPKKIEKFVFLPYLKDLLGRCQAKDGYWTYLEEIHPIINYEHGETYDPMGNEPYSFICSFILSLLDTPPLDSEKIPFCEACVTEMYAVFDPELDVVFDDHDEPCGVSRGEEDLHPLSDLPAYYTDFYDEPEVVGWDLQIPVEEIRSKAKNFKEIVAFLDGDDFPYKKEYVALQEYLLELEQREVLRPKKGNLFARLR